MKSLGKTYDIFWRSEKLINKTSCEKSKELKFMEKQLTLRKARVENLQKSDAMWGEQHWRVSRQNASQNYILSRPFGFFRQ